ncbi:MAG: hypothetical protein R2705_00770 [Ilumatobacteraceae bacterium]
MLGWFERQRWFLVADVAGLLRGLLDNLSLATLIGLLLVPATWFVLWRTKFGLRIRSSGEAPEAAESLGVNVFRLRYWGVLISGGFAGLGGGYLSIVSSSYYRQGQTAGRGFIGLATMIFGNWRPTGLLAGAGLFGFSEALKLRRDDSLPALFLFVFFVAVVFVIAALLRQRMAAVAAAVVAGLGFLFLYLQVDEPPESLTQAAPYLVTLIVLATASQRLRPPAHAGQPYPERYLSGRSAPSTLLRHRAVRRPRVRHLLPHRLGDRLAASRQRHGLEDVHARGEHLLLRMVASHHRRLEPARDLLAAEIRGLSVDLRRGEPVARLAGRQATGTGPRRVIAATVFDLGALFYFKYFEWARGVSNDALGTGFTPTNIILPIGVSFIAFQGLGYVIDVSQGTIQPVDTLDFFTYLFFFPHLVAGPLVRVGEFVPQLYVRSDPAGSTAPGPSP